MKIPNSIYIGDGQSLACGLANKSAQVFRIPYKEKGSYSLGNVIETLLFVIQLRMFYPFVLTPYKKKIPYLIEMKNNELVFPMLIIWKQF